MPPALAAGLLDALDGLDAAAVEIRRPPGGGVELTAPRELLREALLVALDEAADALGRHCTRLLRDEDGSAGLRARLAELGCLLDLLEGLER